MSWAGGWSAAGLQRRLLQGPCDDHPSSHTGPRFTQKVLRAQSACLRALGGRLQDWRPQKKPQENSRQGQKQTQEEGGCEWLPGWEGRQRPPKPS